MWAGARWMACGILAAPPNLDWVSAIANATNGRSFGLFEPEYSPALIGWYAAIYQLVARSEENCVRLGADGLSVSNQ